MRAARMSMHPDYFFRLKFWVSSQKISQKTRQRAAFGYLIWIFSAGNFLTIFFLPARLPTAQDTQDSDAQGSGWRSRIKDAQTGEDRSKKIRIFLPHFHEEAFPYRTTKGAKDNGTKGFPNLCTTRSRIGRQPLSLKGWMSKWAILCRDIASHLHTRSRRRVFPRTGSNIIFHLSSVKKTLPKRKKQCSFN